MEKKLTEKYDWIRYLVGMGGKPLLFENNHLIPYMTDYFDVIFSKIKDTIRHNKTKCVVIRKDFGNLNCFFNQCNIVINLTIDNSLSTVHYDGGYDQRGVKLDGDKLNNVKIICNILTPEDLLNYICASCIYHELTHAYEDYQRLLKSGSFNNLDLYTSFSKYNEKKNIVNIAPPYGGYVAKILNYISKVEQNAYISGAIGEFEHYLKYNPHFKRQPTSTVVYSLPIYKEFEKMENMIHELLDVDSDTKQQLLMPFNALECVIGKFNVLQPWKNRYYHFNDYYQLILWMQDKLYNAQENIVNKISQYLTNKNINRTIDG